MPAPAANEHYDIQQERQRWKSTAHHAWSHCEREDSRRAVQLRRGQHGCARLLGKQRTPRLLEVIRRTYEGKWREWDIEGKAQASVWAPALLTLALVFENGVERKGPGTLENRKRAPAGTGRPHIACSLITILKVKLNSVPRDTHQL
ncbi:unnamed protein product [Lota lota]